LIEGLVVCLCISLANHVKLLMESPCQEMRDSASTFVATIADATQLHLEEYRMALEDTSLINTRCNKFLQITSVCMSRTQKTVHG
jgi:hypothetical protein